MRGTLKHRRFDIPVTLIHHVFCRALYVRQFLSVYLWHTIRIERSTLFHSARDEAHGDLRRPPSKWWGAKRYLHRKCERRWDDERFVSVASCISERCSFESSHFLLFIFRWTTSLDLCDRFVTPSSGMEMRENFCSLPVGTATVPLIGSPHPIVGWRSARNFCSVPVTLQSNSACGTRTAFYL